MSFEYFQGWWSLELSGHWFQCLTPLMENLSPYGFNLCPFPFALLLLTPDKSFVLCAVQPPAMSTSLLSPPFPAWAAPAPPGSQSSHWSELSCGVVPCPSWWSSLLWTGLCVSGCFFHPKLPLPSTTTKISVLAEIGVSCKIYWAPACNSKPWNVLTFLPWCAIFGTYVLVERWSQIIFVNIVST